MFFAYTLIVFLIHGSRLYADHLAYTRIFSYIRGYLLYTNLCYTRIFLLIHWFFSLGTDASYSLISLIHGSSRLYTDRHAYTRIVLLIHGFRLYTDLSYTRFSLIHGFHLYRVFTYTRISLMHGFRLYTDFSYTRFSLIQGFIIYGFHLHTDHLAKKVEKKKKRKKGGTSLNRKRQAQFTVTPFPVFTADSYKYFFLSHLHFLLHVHLLS